MYYRGVLDHIDSTAGLTRFDFLNELHKDTIKSERGQTGGAAVISGVCFRPLKWKEAGSVIEEHLHNFDHATMIVQGSVMICTAPVPDQVEIDGEMRTLEKNWGTEIQYRAPAICPINKNVWHRMIALEPSYGFCVFASRDPETGEVVSIYNGFHDAFV